MSRRCVGRMAALRRLCSRIATEPSGEPCEVMNTTTKSSAGSISAPTWPMAAAILSGVAAG